MAYELVLTEKEPEGAGRPPKGISTSFYTDLPQDYEVFLLYFRESMPDKALEKALVALGKNMGKNLLVNLNSAADTSYKMIVERFGIEKFPVIIMTAVGDLAAVSDGSVTTFAKLDSEALLSSPEKTVECAEQLFNLFMQGKVKEAISTAKWTQRTELLKSLGSVVGDGLKAVGKFISTYSISFSAIEGKFELKRSGE